MKKLRKISFAIFCVSLAASIIFWFTQVRKGDRIGPVITMEKEELTVKLDAKDKDFLKGVKAIDEKDGDVSSSLVVESVSNFLSGGKRLVVYAAMDSHNNVSRASRLVKYKNYSSPKFTLSKPFCFPSSSSASGEDILENLKAKDKIDGDLTGQIRILSNSAIRLYKKGEYPVKLQVTNSAGDTVSFSPTIQVYDSEKSNKIPFIHLKKYLVYVKKGHKINPRSYIKKVCTGGGFDSDMRGDILTSKVSIKDEVNYKKTGSYEITYSVKTPKGVTGSVKLIVIVTE